MVLGMSLPTFTFLHVLISLIGIGAGLVMMYGFLAGKRLNGINTIFLIFTILTSATGFLFPFEHLLPSHIIGTISLVILAVAVLARSAYRLHGSWRWIYVVTASIALYLNVFVLIFQSFLKVPALHALAPKGNEPPFAVAQLVVLLVFIGLTILATKRFRLEPARVA